MFFVLAAVSGPTPWLASLASFFVFARGAKTGFARKIGRISLSSPYSYLNVISFVSWEGAREKRREAGERKDPSFQNNSNMADHSLPPSGNEEIPSPLKLQRSFYSLAAVYAISYGSISTTNYYFTFGSRPGASEASIEQADSVFQLVNSLYPALWLIFLFFVPAFMDALGPRNSFTLMMFAWAIAFCFLVGAFVIADGGPSPLIPIFGIMYSIFIGCFAGLGYTASESYLDYCAEWMPIALSVNSDEISVKEQLSNDAAENDIGAMVS